MQVQEFSFFPVSLDNESVISILELQFEIADCESLMMRCLQTMLEVF